MKCTRLAYNKQPSILFDTLFSILGDENKADEAYSFFKSDIFKDSFDNWEENKDLELEDMFISLNRLDDNFEPKLIFDNKYRKYYYLDKNNNKVYYPISERKLSKLYTRDRIKDISSILALKFFKSRLGENFDEVDLSAKKELLTPFIEKTIKDKAEELKSSKDFKKKVKGKTLEKSLEAIDEWVTGVEGFFKEIKLNYVESESKEAALSNEDNTRENQWDQASFEKDYKDNVNSNIKLYLALLVDTNKLDDVFFEPKFIPFKRTYDTLLGILTNKAPIMIDGKVQDMFKLYLEDIYKAIDKKPEMSVVYEALNRLDDDNIKAQFVQAFNLHKNNFISTTVNYDTEETTDPKTGEVTVTDKVTSIIQNVSDTGAKFNAVKQNWFYYFVKEFADEKNQFNKDSLSKIKSKEKEFKGISSVFKKNYDTYDEQNFENFVNTFQEFLSSIGVKVTNEGFYHYLDNLNPDFQSLDDRLEKLYELVDSTSYLLENASKSIVTLEKNPIVDQNEFNKLARAEAYYLENKSDSSIRSGNKTKWGFSNPSYVSFKIKQWKQDSSLLYNLYNKGAYYKGSYYMNYILAFDENGEVNEQEYQKRIEQLEVLIFNSLQEDGKGRYAVDNKTMGEIDAKADLYNKLLNFRKQSGLAYISSPTPADKSTQLQFNIPKELMVDTNTTYAKSTKKYNFNEKAKLILYNYVKAEFDRIKEVKSEIENLDPSELRIHYHLGNKNGLKFQLFKDLNNNEFTEKTLGVSLLEDLTDTTLIKFKDVHDFEAREKGSIEDKLVEFITNEVGKRIEATYSDLRDNNILSVNNKGEEVNNAIDSEVWSSYGNTKSKGIKAAGDIYINSLISYVEYSKMFAGDIAYYKDKADYKKRIPATYTDGSLLYLKPGEEYFNVSVIEGVNISTPYLKELKKYLPESIWKYYEHNEEKGREGINSTDAQAWITPKRWKFLMEKLGKWSSAHDDVYAKMNSSNPVFTASELKLAAQPVKGVYFDVVDGVPVYLKYSQAVLLPNLTRNLPELKGLVDRMNQNNIDEVITIDGVKVGAIQPVKTHDETGKFLEDYTLTSMQLPNAGWKLQQDLPTKTVKPTELGSQIQKNIFAGLASNLDKDFIIGEEILTGKEVGQRINKIINLLSNQGLANLKNEFGINPDGTITNIQRLNSALIKELKTRGSNENVIRALEAGVSPFGIPGYQKKLQNIFASIVLKRLVKIKTNGGSFIQMSNYGFSKQEAESSGVIWAPWAEETTSEPKYLEDEEGNIVYVEREIEKIIDEEGTVEKITKKVPVIQPGGIFISGSLIAKYIPNYKDYTDKQLFGTKEKDYKDAIIDKRILDNIIGYRIPNQGLASNDALQVVGILPEEMGDTIVAYTGITTKTGSDFDIDKMYIMVPSFNTIFNNEKKIRKYIESKLRGKNITETISNIENLLDQIEYEDLDAGMSPEEIVEFMTHATIIDQKRLIYQEFIEAILNSKSDVATDIKKDIEGFNEVSKLIYVTPPKEIDENTSKKALQNALIESYKGVLASEHNLEEVMTPIDFPFIKDDILSMYPKDTEENLDAFDVLNEIDVKYSFFAGKAGVGMTANSLVDHIRGLMGDTGFNKYFIGAGNKNENGDTSLDQEFSEELTDEEFNYYKKETGKGEGLKKIKIANTLSAIMNAYVDIAKDPYITKGNWTTQTANIGFLLVRAGVHPFKVNAFLGQPVITNYINFIINSESKINKDSGFIDEKFAAKRTRDAIKKSNATFIVDNKAVSYLSLFDSLPDIKEITTQNVIDFTKGKLTEEVASNIATTLQKVVDKYAVKKETNKDFSDLSLKSMRENIKAGGGNTNLENTILTLFRQYKDKSKMAGDNMKAAKVDVNGYGKDDISHLITTNIINKVLDNEGKEGNFFGFSSKLVEEDGNLTFLGSYINNSIIKIGEVLGNNSLNFVISSPRIKSMINAMSLSVKSTKLESEKLGDLIGNSIYSYMMSSFPPLQLDKAGKKNLLQNLPSKLLSIKKELPNNELIASLDVIVGENNVSYISMSNRVKTPTEESEIIDAWNDLLEDPKYTEFANNLVKYSFLTSGFEMNKNQFFSYIPYEFFHKGDINSHVKRFVDEVSINDLSENIFKHNYTDSSLVPNVPFTQIKKAEKGMLQIEPFTIENTGYLIAEYPPYIKRTLRSKSGKKSYILYKLYATTGNSGVYTQTNMLGYRDSKGNRIYEYDAIEGKDASMIKSNQVPSGNLDYIDKAKTAFTKLSYVQMEDINENLTLLLSETKDYEDISDLIEQTCE